MSEHPIILDGVEFRSAGADREQSFRDGALIGELELEEIEMRWRARKGDGDWRPMRSAAEARAYICSSRDWWFGVVAKRKETVA